MIHSFMFIYMACKNGTIHMELTMDPFYWTGIIAIITLAYLVFASWSVFRKMNYELFKKSAPAYTSCARAHIGVG
jgi:DMSO/TMAO reductase YedYZ heme-binding membrane subunit